MSSLSVNNFFDRYMFKATSKELSKTDQQKALAVSIGGGILSLGSLHLITAGANLIRFKGKVIREPINEISSKFQSKEFYGVDRESHSTISDIPISPKINENKIRAELRQRNVSERDVKSVICLIQEIAIHSSIFGNPILYSEDNIAYFKKNENIPLTLQAHKEGNIYIHFKSSITGKDIIDSACQKKVYRAINTMGEVVAASVIHDNKTTNKNTFDKEVTALTLFKNCPYVVKILNLSTYKSEINSIDETKYGLIMEYCEGTTYSDFYDRLTPKECIEFFLKVLRGAQGINEQGYSHFDYKADNILYKKINNVFEPRIIDFGVIQPHGPNTNFKAFRGAYQPPEIFIHDRYDFDVTEKVDVWQLGMYGALNILNLDPKVEWGEKHYDRMGNWFFEPELKVNFENSLDEFFNFSILIHQMLQINPNQRISMKAAIMQIEDLLQYETY